MNSRMSFMMGYFGATRTDQKALAVYEKRHASATHSTKQTIGENPIATAVTHIHIYVPGCSVLVFLSVWVSRILYFKLRTAV